jgi:hypothetical protein
MPNIHADAVYVSSTYIMMPPEIAIRNSEYLRVLGYEEAQFADDNPKYTNLFIYYSQQFIL